MHPAAPPHTACKSTKLPFGSSQRSPTANCRRNRAGTCTARTITTIQEEQRSRSVLGVQPGEPHGSLRQQERPLQDFPSRTSFCFLRFGNVAGHVRSNNACVRALPPLLARSTGPSPFIYTAARIIASHTPWSAPCRWVFQASNGFRNCRQAERSQ